MTTTTPTADTASPTLNPGPDSVAEVLERSRDAVRRALEQDRPAATTAAYPATSFEVGQPAQARRVTPIDDLDAALEVLQAYTGVGMVAPLRLIAGNVRIHTDAISTERDSLTVEVRTLAGKLEHARVALAEAAAGLDLTLGIENAINRVGRTVDQRDAYIRELELLLLEDPKISRSVTARTMKAKIASAKEAVAAAYLSKS